MAHPAFDCVLLLSRGRAGRPSSPAAPAGPVGKCAEAGAWPLIIQLVRYRRAAAAPAG